MKLEWSRHAVADRDEIITYIAAEDPEAAVRVDERISRMCARLRDFPLLGRPGRVEGTRELTIPRVPYIAVYRIGEDKVRILRVIHAARRWPSRFPQA